MSGAGRSVQVPLGRDQRPVGTLDLTLESRRVGCPSARLEATGRVVSDSSRFPTWLLLYQRPFDAQLSHHVHSVPPSGALRFFFAWPAADCMSSRRCRGAVQPRTVEPPSSKLVTFPALSCSRSAVRVRRGQTIPDPMAARPTSTATGERWRRSQHLRVRDPTAPVSAG